jgi:hypothetical protein
MVFSRRKLALLGLTVALVPAFTLMRARGSDHADTPTIAATPGADLTDVFIFPSPTDSTKVVLAMNVHPLIPLGQGPSTVFDPNVLYQFKIDNSGDNVEDLVIQVKFNGTSPGSQVAYITGPVAPVKTGTVTQYAGTPDSVTGVINTTFTTSTGMKVFTGAREDPFFFDLSQFFTILPDRATPVNGVAVPPAQANVPQSATWRAAGVAQDYLANFNVMSIVVELPKSRLIGSGDGNIRLWCTTSK